MSDPTISTFELFSMFPDEAAARAYLEARRWPDGARCPVCASGERITTRKAGYYRCNACREDFTVRTGTVFERSKIPLRGWLYAMYLLVTARKGISSMQLGKQLGITQKSAWFALHRLREACGDEIAKLGGIVEIDETYIGGKNRNKHAGKKLKAGRGAVGKAAVLGMRERGGKVKAMHVESTDGNTVHQAIHEHVEVGAELHTDEAATYTGIGGLFFGHQTINHSAGEYARGNVTTNGMESVFAVMKRGVMGVYHHTSPKHLDRYVQEFAWRLNDGNCRAHTLARLDALIRSAAGKRLTYADLTQ